MNKINTRVIVSNSMVAALYVVLTLITYPFSFLGIQFRIAEFLVLLCFFRKDYAIGLVIGCAIANLASTIGVVDVGFGSLATLIACLGIMFSKRLAIAIIFPIVSNAFIVGFELYMFLGEPFWLSTAQVAIGETAVMIVSYIFYMIMRKRPTFYELINAKQNIEFKW